MASNDLFAPLSTGPLSSGTPANHNFLGEDPLPAQFGAVTAMAPGLLARSDTIGNIGGQYVQQGGQALGMAQRGELTDPQKAELGQFQTGLTNQARQQFYGMGRTPDKDTAFIGATADIDAKVNAMAQQEIQSTIALGLGETQAGANFFGQSLGFDQAAIQALLAAGSAQLQQDQDYRKSLTDTFSTIGKMFGTIGGAAIGGMFGGPAGAGAGASIGGSVGSSISTSGPGGWMPAPYAE